MPNPTMTPSQIAESRALIKEGLDSIGNDPVAALSFPNGGMVFALADCFTHALDTIEELRTEVERLREKIKDADQFADGLMEEGAPR